MARASLLIVGLMKMKSCEMALQASFADLSEEERRAPRMRWRRKVALRLFNMHCMH